MHDYYFDEGSFLWFQAELGTEQQDVSFAVGKYRDTGQDLETWVGIKSKEIESARAIPVSLSHFVRNDINMVEICSNGSISGTPTPACFVYMRQEPWIIELRIESYNSNLFEQVQRYAETYSSQFHFFKDTSGWLKYSSFNNGYKLDFPSEILPLDTLPAHFVASFHKQSTNSIFQVITIYGASADLEKYWYDVQRNEMILTSKIPNEVRLDRRRCLMYTMRSEGNDMYIIMCKVGDRLQKIEMVPGSDQNILNDMLGMLYSFKFSSDYIVNDKLDKFKEGTLFQLTYPNYYTAYDEGGAESAYISFNENVPDGLPHRVFSISYQETALSIDSCTKEANCMLVGTDLSLYSRTTFKDISALVRVYTTEQSDQNITTTNYIFGKNGTIYSINLNTIGTTGNIDVNAILESLTFL
jgi:hypothetical protein